MRNAVVVAVVADRLIVVVGLLDRLGVRLRVGQVLEVQVLDAQILGDIRGVAIMEAAITEDIAAGIPVDRASCYGLWR